MARKASERTSYEVRRNWDKEHYTQMAFRVPKETAEAFRNKCKELNQSQNALINEAIKRFLEEA